MIRSTESDSQGRPLEECTQQIYKDTKIFLKDFVKKWSNFTDVYQGNQAVRKYLTEKCIQDNSIDTDPHVQMKIKGKIP